MDLELIKEAKKFEHNHLIKNLLSRYIEVSEKLNYYRTVSKQGNLDYITEFGKTKRKSDELRSQLSRAVSCEKYSPENMKRILFDYILPVVLFFVVLKVLFYFFG